MPTNPGDANLAWYHELEESSGTRSPSVGTQVLGETATVNSAAGIQGNAADFDGGGTAYLAATDHADMTVAGDISWAISFWVYLDTVATSKPLVNKYQGGDASADYIFLLGTASAGSAPVRFVMRHNGGGTFEVTGGSIGSAGWHHICATRTGGTVYLYVDGTSVGTPYAGGQWGNDGTYSLQLMARSSSSAYTDGRLDELGIWNGAGFSQDNIDWMYNSGTGRTLAEIQATSPAVDAFDLIGAGYYP